MENREPLREYEGQEASGRGAVVKSCAGRW
jgi:hypothetical protein